MIDKENDLKWFQVVIDDPLFLTYESFLQIIKCLKTVVNFEFVIVDGIEGSGRNYSIHSLQKIKDKPLKIDELLKFFENIKQIDWGDFYFFQNYPLDWNNPKGEMYPYVISQSNTTLRAVDNQYFYVYTPYNKLVDALKANYTIEEIRKGTLDQLDYPE